MSHNNSIPCLPHSDPSLIRVPCSQLCCTTAEDLLLRPHNIFNNVDTNNY